jgi:SAM-dependent methyltransferase
MGAEFYREYVTDDAFMADYLAYQQKYAVTMRESDKRMIAILRSKLGAGRKTVADIGCSTGNFLMHLKRLCPDFELVGGELAPKALELCRADPALAGIRFESMDAVQLGRAAEFDAVTLNAVLYLFEPSHFESAIASLSRSLRPGGWMIAFDWFHSWEQELAIRETSKTHPNGLMIHLRSYSRVRPILAQHGFVDETFEPFMIPIDLPRPTQLDDMASYTTADRLIFRGSLAQPWCFLAARKA